LYQLRLITLKKKKIGAGKALLDRSLSEKKWSDTVFLLSMLNEIQARKAFKHWQPDGEQLLCFFPSSRVVIQRRPALRKANAEILARLVARTLAGKIVSYKSRHREGAITLVT
jgi:hypothetical protein